FQIGWSDKFTVYFLLGLRNIGRNTSKKPSPETSAGSGTAHLVKRKAASEIHDRAAPLISKGYFSARQWRAYLGHVPRSEHLAGVELVVYVRRKLHLVERAGRRMGLAELPKYIYLAIRTRNTKPHYARYPAPREGVKA